jgi:MFS transporter, DHA1 family, tetracycline resistance protein
MKPPASRAAIAFILISVLLDVLSFGVLIPVVPSMILEFTHGDESHAAFYVGVFGTAWACMQFIFSPILGALSDRFGRRPIILLSCFGLGLDFLLIGFAQNLTWLFIGRVISGITASGFATAGAYIADVTPPEKRSAAYGLFGAAFGIGFTLGPAVGGLLGEYSLRLPCWVAAGLTLVNACYGYFILPESHAIANRRPFSWSRANPVGSLHLLRSYPGLLGLAVVYFLYQLSHQVLNNVFILYAKYRYDWSPGYVGGTLMLVGILNILVQGGLVRIAVKKFGQNALLYTGLAFGGLGYALYGLAPTGLVFIAVTPVLSFMGFFNPAIQGLMSQRLGPSVQGGLQGANACLTGIAGMIGPTLFTSTFEWGIQGDATRIQPTSGLPFWIASFLLLIAIFVARKSLLAWKKRTADSAGTIDNISTVPS